MVAVVDMVGPHGVVHQMNILHGHVSRIADIHQSWPLGILVGALRIPFPSDPELLPVSVAVAVDGACAGDGEAVGMVGVDKGREVLAGLSFEAGFENGIVGDAV